jgi:radical SAM protein with 4Fe4S-binding SPASM domain
MDAGLLKLGNLRDTEIAGIADHPVKQLIAKRQEVLASSDCADCRFFDVCHGGCPIDSYVNRSDMLCKSTFCETKKIFYEEFVEPLLGISIRRRNIAEGTAS